MNWNKEFGTYEWLLIGLFFLAYLIYTVRFVRVQRQVSGRPSVFAFKFLLRSAIFALFLAAWLGPSFGQAQREIKAIGKDIFICVDLSTSMNAEDVQPSRLEKVKFELLDMIDAFSSDRVGLIIFGQEAFMQCPLTYDGSALSIFTETLHTGLVPNGGTDFAPPLKLAQEKLLDEAEGAGSNSSRLVILISDGEDFGEEAQEIARDYRQNGIKLMTLGVGTEQGGRIKEGRRYKRDRQGQEVVTRLESGSLQKLAKTARGQYFEINDRVNDTQRLINSVNALEGQFQESKLVDVSNNKFYYFLAAALILLVIDSLFTPKLIRL
jgi:Ca-activated chloride channel family protein